MPTRSGAHRSVCNYLAIAYVCVADHIIFLNKGAFFFLARFKIAMCISGFFQQKAPVNNCFHFDAFNRLYSNQRLLEYFIRKRRGHFLASAFLLQAFVYASCREDWRVDKCRFRATNFCPECRKLNRRFYRCWRRISCCSRSPCPLPVI